uniref:Uncharacterized protein n=1 Tax=Plectus sambesii TaxID=2011161 RepID=A0A914VPJ2_9BILA
MNCVWMRRRRRQTTARRRGVSSLVPPNRYAFEAAVEEGAANGCGTGRSPGAQSATLVTGQPFAGPLVDRSRSRRSQIEATNGMEHRRCARGREAAAAAPFVRRCLFPRPSPPGIVGRRLFLAVQRPAIDTRERRASSAVRAAASAAAATANYILRQPLDAHPNGRRPDHFPSNSCARHPSRPAAHNANCHRPLCGAASSSKYSSFRKRAVASEMCTRPAMPLDSISFAKLTSFENTSNLKRRVPTMPHMT